MFINRLAAALLLLTACATVEGAEKHGNNWYFGFDGGLTFASGSPQPLTGGQISASEGCATISDSDGNLLFYTDGSVVLNASHVVMPNGSGLLGHPASTQSAIVIPSPASEDIYYIFTADAAPGGVNGMNYTVVDLTLYGGNGDVVTSQKNVNLMATCSEQLAAIRNADGSGYWVFARAINSNAIHAFEVTSVGVNHTAVISNVGVSTGAVGEFGYMKPSTDGTKLAMAYYSDGSAEYYQVDPSTGVVSDAVDLGGLLNPYGVEFSRDGSRLYVSTLSNAVFQFDLEAADIAASKVQIGNVSCGALQLGPDGKIYCARSGQTALAVIHSPETLGAGCDFENAAVSIDGTCAYGLPSFPQSFFAPAMAPTVATTAASNVTSSSASAGGEVTADGGAAVSARGVCWSTSHLPTIADGHTSNGAGIGSFASELTGLNQGTTYYIRAYATNSAGTAYGDERSLTTASSPAVPTVTTATVSAVSTTSALCGGTVTSNGGGSVTARGVCWGTSSGPTVSGDRTIDGSGTGGFVSTLTGLSADTTYYVRAYATNSAGTAYGMQRSFTTQAIGTATGPDIHVEITARVDGAMVGDEIEFEIDVRNDGAGVANDCTLNFAVPGNTSFVSLNLLEGASHAPMDVAIADGAVSTELGKIDPGQVIAMLLKLHVISAGVIKVTATANGSGMTAEVSGESGAIEAIDVIGQIISTGECGMLCGASSAAQWLMAGVLLCGMKRRRTDRRPPQRTPLTAK
ncbi:MAG: hypothetical protein KF841_09975 [Phycisphaerae bacterium]|nr:hypothetical protein [Phycisphaerae bacterium]